ncbi:flagellar brake protein [Mixta tenebrionis]|uniref:Flagellar brake protein YcgR n=1 Tax=Mixta tenebrionis TaxID=2562439 RepID=A0A506VH12_9GAMM|nr:MULTISPECIES: flagellar brake protein [Mixta]QHM75804.1 Flagellar brake protein YcgR [Mixta theicola]TPW44340.1 flagellar brake protein [Mixta tenebrionis]
MKEPDNEQFYKRGALAVLGVLRDIGRDSTPLLVSHARGQFISRLLFVDQTQLVIDYGSHDYDNQVTLEVRELRISAEMRGAKVEFTLPQLHAIQHEGLPAFGAPLPPELLQIQRREYFRISAPLDPIFYCHATWPQGGSARFRMQDLSLGGVGVLVDSELPENLVSGDIWRGLRLDMGEYGEFKVDAQLLHVGWRTAVSSKNETIHTPRLSFRFISLSAAQERQLQQIIFSLERVAREKAMRFR